MREIMPKDTSVSCLVDVPRVKADMEQLSAEVATGGETTNVAKSLLKDRQRFLKAVERSRLPKKKHLAMFVFLAQRYRNGSAPLQRDPVPEIAPVETVIVKDKTAETGTTKREPGRNLIRDPAKVQTQIAEILVKTYKPGDTFSITTAIDKLRHFVPEGSNPGQWLGTYMMREMRHTNGILENEGPRRYRIRADAPQLLKNGPKPLKPNRSVNIAGPS